VIKSRRIWAGHVTHMGVMKNTNNILVGKPKGKQALRRCRHKWEDIRMNLREIGWEVVDSSGSGWHQCELL
jgi:hypothetical protein